MLPRIQHRIITTRFPVSGEPVRFRPMTGREEKLLLLAKESSADEEILSTVLQIVSNCLVDEIDVETMPIHDVEWLFVQIRINSVSNVSNVSYLDPTDDRVYSFEVDLTEIEVVKPETGPGSIDLGDGVRVQLRYPPAKAFISDRVRSAPTDAETAHQLALECIGEIYDGDSLVTPDNIEELDEFVQAFGIESYRELMDHVASIPSLRYVIQYQNSRGEGREIVLSTLTDFFTFR